MKQIIAAVLVLIMCLALCACGASSPTPNPAEVLYEKYADIIDALEAEDYDGAIIGIQNLIPIPEEPPYSEIEITIDNWTEYFVIENVEDWHTNPFGEVDDLKFDVMMYIKPEYAGRVVNNENAIIDYDISYDNIVQTIEIDYPTKTYAFTDYHISQKSFQNVGTCSCFQLIDGISVINTRMGYGTINDIPQMGFYDNVTVNRIQGTLCLYDE